MKYALFVSFFTNIIAGPIERAKRLLPQINNTNSFDFDRFRHGFLVMLYGYFLKLVIADRISIFVDTVYGDISKYNGFYLIVATALYGIQIFCDFAGYSTISLGAAEILGFDIINNFEAPYIANSCTQFWRRWHISLSSWFRDYVYIPLGGNRKGRLHKYLNILIVFLLSGLWHGASFSFVVWGLINGLYQVIGDILKPYRDKILTKLNIKTKSIGHHIIQTIITFMLIDFAWIFFRAERLLKAIRIIRSIFSARNIWILFDGSLFKCGLDADNFHLLIICIVILIVIEILHYNKINITDIIINQDAYLRWVFIALAITFILTFGIWGPGFSESNFIYQGF